MAERRAVFLDRDGTINEERGYVHRPADFRFLPGAPEAIRTLKEAGFLVVVVTNQSGVARGYYGEEEVEALHRHMDRELAKEGAAVDGYYYCPHHPEKGQGKYLRECDCRKPLPGLLLRASRELGISLVASFLVGDKESDVQAALAAGCSPLLVSSGSACEAELVPEGVPVCRSLAEAAAAILGKM